METENKNFEEKLLMMAEFLATTEKNDIEKMPWSKEAKDFIWKKLVIPFQSYLIINDLTSDEVCGNILSELLDMATEIMDEELIGLIKKANEEGKQGSFEIHLEDFLDEMEVLLFKFVNTITENGGDEYVLSILNKVHKNVA